MLRISSMVQMGASSSRSVSRLQSRHIHQALSSEHLKLAWAAGAVSKMAHQHGCSQAAAVPHHVNLFIGLLECPHSIMAAGFPQTKGKNDKEATVPLLTKSQKSSAITFAIFHSLAASHYILSTLKGRELSPTSWREEGQQIFGYVLKLSPLSTQVQVLVTQINGKLRELEGEIRTTLHDLCGTLQSRRAGKIGIRKCSSDKQEGEKIASQSTSPV